jgi:CBS domain-containing protein
MLVNLVSTSLTAYDTAHALSSVGEAITQRILKLAIDELGEPPVKFAWIAAGSLARLEQTVHSDQDNAMILANDYDEAQHGDYFKALAKFVTDGLDACGYEYCPGDVMAINEQWRQPLRVWEQYFDEWINKPEKKALMYVSIFFDLRCLCGDSELLDNLQRDILEKTKGNTIFLAYMAANALQYRPPLGFFRSFVLERGGREEPALDMKRRGVTPIVDLARVYALESGLPELNTHDRLLAAAKVGALSEAGMEDLRDAYEFISETRLRHQMRQIQSDAEPDNYVPPNELSALERRHLKDAFDVVRTMQSALEQRFQTERIA